MTEAFKLGYLAAENLLPFDSTLLKRAHAWAHFARNSSWWGAQELGHRWHDYGSGLREGVAAIRNAPLKNECR